MNPSLTAFRSTAPWRRLLAAGLLALAAGGALAADDAAERARLLERARAYWAAIQANDRATAWNYEDISLDPNWTLQGYLRRGGIRFEDVTVEDVARLEGDQAAVRVRTRISLPQAGIRNQESEFEDLWRRIDGQWFHAPKRD